jgi:Eukaryotic-type carbonic anhydrase
MMTRSGTTPVAPPTGRGGRCRFLVFLPVVVAFALSLLPSPCHGQNSDGAGYLDRFTYKDEDDERADGFIDYAPENWGDISCNEGSKLDECVGYRDKWHTGRGWSIQENHCKWCPDGSNRCDRHRQSPINLRREFGLEPGTHENANECIDSHWMKYEDSFCDLKQMVDSGAFTIERHGLRIAQPITVLDSVSDDNDGKPDGVTLDCQLPGRGSRFGRIDYSKGFSEWWYLSHIDLHVPSEHYQDGVRYDAEIQIQHFYSIPPEEAGGNSMGTVAVLMKAYDDVPPYPYLDKVICQWRRHEYDVRTECGLDPVDSTYPGCFPLTRRNLRESGGDGSINKKKKRHPRFQTAMDVLLYNEQHRNHPNHTDIKIHMEESNWAPAQEKDWDAWIQEQSDKMRDEDELYHRMKKMDHSGNHTDDLHEQYRKLLQYDELEWFNYWPLLGVRTEYYFRYSGGQTIPPCYGNFNENSRAETNHWRVMKDPTRIHPRQLKELKRLIAERIAPSDDPVKPCKPDTAAKVTRDDNEDIVDVEAARPLQDWNLVHFKTFCECKDWGSKWPEDREWCLEEDIEKRFYDHPYNFDSGESLNPEK